MKRPWFMPLGWFFCPVSVPGVLIAVAALGFCAQVFRAVDRHSHSVSDTFYGVFPFFATVFLLVDWVASRSSPPRGEPGSIHPEP